MAATRSRAPNLLGKGQAEALAGDTSRYRPIPGQNRETTATRPPWEVRGGGSAASTSVPAVGGTGHTRLQGLTPPKTYPRLAGVLNHPVFTKQKCFFLSKTHASWLKEPEE